MSTAKQPTKSTSRSAPKQAAGKSAAKTGSGKGGNDALSLLTQDHKEVRALFKEFDKLVDAAGDDDERLQIAQDICTKLTAHAAVEEEIFYPAAREALGEAADLVDEADIEHASAKELIAQIEASSPGEDDHFDAKVRVLGEYIEHHVKEEEGQMFALLKKADLDLGMLGEEMAARKEKLLQELGVMPEEA